VKTEEDLVARSLAACGTVHYTSGEVGGAPKMVCRCNTCIEVGGHHFEKLV
jgi:hypothetical protein